MAIYIALLRGMNVGSRKKIEMPELIAAFESLGFEDVKTYIQSGNVVFDSTEKDKNELSSMIQEKIKWAFNYPVSVVLRTANELQGIIATNPFLKDSKIDTNKLHVTFLSDKPTVLTLN